MLQYLFTKTPLFFLVQPFWRDEAFSYLLAKRSLVDILFITARDYNPPFYYLVLHFWMKVFGSSEVAIRMLSFVFFLLAVFMIYIILENILEFSERKSLFYILLVIINPLLVYFAFEGRMYTMFAFFAVLSSYFFLKKNNQAYVIATLLGFLTHYYMFFLLFAQGVHTLIFHRIKRWEALKPLFMTFLMMIPWILFVIREKDFSNSSFWISRLQIQNIPELIGRLYSGYEFGFSFFDAVIVLSYFLWIIVIFGILKFKKQGSKVKRVWWYLLLWGVITPLLIGIISLFQPIWFTRYLIFANAGFLLLLVAFLDKLAMPVRVSIFILLFATTMNFHVHQINSRKKADLAKEIREIKKLAGPEDFLYVTSELDFFTAQYYFGEENVRIYDKTYEEIPPFVGKVLIPKDKIVRIFPRFPRKAFVLSSDGSYEIKASY